jgi:uncharacterized membrane protein YdjX (TVP38/TMEM64 family)
MNKKVQHILKVLWIRCILICVITYIVDPSIFSNNSVATFISEFSGYAWGVYFLIHILRGFVLMPSTPLIFAGVILFPNQLIWVLIVSIIGILSSSLLIYYCSNKLGFSKYFKKRNDKLQLVEEKLSGKHGFFYILLWSFLPIVPTDLICYVSGALRVKLPVFISSLFLGELVLCSIYIFGASIFIN